MLTKRIIPCLDVSEGQVVKGVNFVNLKEVGNPVLLGKGYWQQGADELVYLDITATSTKKPILLELIEKVSTNIFIPFTIGGGIRSIEEMETILKAGADKISINSAAVKNPNLIEESAQQFGSQCVVVAVDVKKEGRSWKVYTHGGRKRSQWDVMDWLEEIEQRGAGEILLTSMDRDGTKSGFDLKLYQKAARVVNLPIIASGGGGKVEDFIALFTQTEVDAALAASIFHYGTLNLNMLKKRLDEEGIPVRMEALQ